MWILFSEIKWNGNIGFKVSSFCDVSFDDEIIDQFFLYIYKYEDVVYVYVGIYIYLTVWTYLKGDESVFVRKVKLGRNVQT